jgi:CubicO group peptidase (beta-lactamase class C family)
MPRRLPRNAPLLIAALAIGSIIAAPVVWKRYRASKIDRLFAEWNRPDSPGCAVGVSRNGSLVYEGAFGMASLELGVPMTSQSVLPAASISKQFAAMSILLLAKAGKLSLDDDIATHIPEWPPHGSPITIRHLLTHTSGLRDAFLLQGFAPPRGVIRDPNDEILQVLLRARGLNFPPGAEFQYNNGAYNLLGTIVKRVSGQSLRAFADENIFKRLRMTRTHFHDDPAMVVPHRVSGYHRDGRGFRVAAENGGIVGNAGLQTTVGDLVRWERNFADIRVGDRELLAAMQTPVMPTGWSATSHYGFGVEISSYRGLRTVGHGGGDRGIASYVVRYPEHDFAVALLCNLDNIGENGTAARLTQQVADVYLADAFPTPASNGPVAPPARVSLSPGQLADKVGLYHDPSNDSVGRIFLREGKLMASVGLDEDPSVELTPVAANRFVVFGTQLSVEFLPAAPGPPQEVRVSGAGPKPAVSRRITASYQPSNSELRAFAGEYRSDEVHGSYTLAPRDGFLVMHIPGRADVPFQPVFTDAFAGDMLGVLKFSRGAGGTVTGFTAHSDGARGLRFDRVNP